jgi:hypothetical protein
VEPLLKKISKALLEFKIGILLKREEYSALTLWKLAPKFFRVFIILAKVTDLGAEVIVIVVLEG